jgi:hypothetical protein
MRNKSKICLPQNNYKIPELKNLIFKVLTEKRRYYCDWYYMSSFISSLKIEIKLHRGDDRDFLPQSIPNNKRSDYRLFVL